MRKTDRNIQMYVDTYMQPHVGIHRDVFMLLHFVCMLLHFKSQVTGHMKYANALCDYVEGTLGDHLGWKRSTEHSKATALQREQTPAAKL